jgi:predicted site-specific integrase-resolvase
MRVAIYARVSTNDKGQDPENQLRELRAWCVNSGHTISREYVEQESGRKAGEKRKQFAALFEDAAKRKIDLVLFWALDRFSREGMAQTIGHREHFSSMPEQDADVLEVLIGKMRKDRDVDAVVRKCAGVLGQAEPCEPIGNFLHRRPRPAEFGLVDPLDGRF